MTDEIEEKGKESALLPYFRQPIPPTGGFSPARNTFGIVQVPVIFLFTAIGFFLCWGDVWLRPLISIYFVVGLYIGRDWTIAAHYGLHVGCLFGLLGWILFFLLVIALPKIPEGGHPFLHGLGRLEHAALAGGGAALLLAFFAIHIQRRLAED